MVKKIVAYVGSEKGKESNTYKFIGIILDRVRELCRQDVEIEIITSSDVHIDNCRKCQKCFEKGSCWRDSADDMSIIKEKLLKADVIIFGSGVYFQQISSEMKNFIERLTYWAHIFRLAGKGGVVVTTSGSNGNEFAEAYLKRIMASLGVQVIASCSCKVIYPMELDNINMINERIVNCAKVISSILEGEKKIKAMPYHEGLFATFKSIYTNQKYMTEEKRYWTDNGYFDCNSYADLIELIERKL